MAIKKYVASADTTITNAFKEDLNTRATGANGGAADIVETFSIYGRQSSSSVELSRILMKFPITEITTDRTNGVIPGSGSVKFYLKMYNAEHSRTVPSGSYKIVAEPLSRDWQEGFGLDIANYKDSTNGNVGANWMVANNTNINEITKVTFSQDALADYGAGAGANYIIIYDTTSRYNLWFNDGSSDEAPDVDGTEQQIDISSTTPGKANIASTFQSVVNSMSAFSSNIDPSDSAVVYVTGSTAGGATDASVEGTLSGITLAVEQQGNNETPWSKVGGDYISAANAAYPYRWFNQTLYNGLEDIEMDITHMVELWADGTVDNYGIGVHLSGNVEGYWSVDKDGTYDGYLLNLTGAKTSYYTKRFFARGTQYFFKKPAIEARWDSSKKDDRGDMYYSSSLAGVNDNLNTIYLYNYVRGRLSDIPGLAADRAIYVSFYSGSNDNSESSGHSGETSTDETNRTSRSAIRLPTTLPYEHVSSDGKNPFVVTGGWVSTGIYTASFALTAANPPLTKIFDVWHDGTGKNKPWASVEFATSSFYPNSISASVAASRPYYYLNITNLRDRYEASETARLNLFVRPKYWDPTIYSVANSTIENTALSSASYTVYRVIDNYDAVPYGTGSNSETMLSYDMSGNYFDFDMRLLEPGYTYAFKFSFYDSDNSSWTEQRQSFKFRVEDYEY